MIDVSIIDRENIQYLINGLEDFEKDKAVKSGLRSAMNVFRARGKNNLRSRLLFHGRHTGHLMNSFTTRIKRRKLGGLAGFDRPGGNHAHLVDMGTKRRYTTGKRRCVREYIAELCRLTAFGQTQSRPRRGKRYRLYIRE